MNGDSLLNIADDFQAQFYIDGLIEKGEIEVEIFFDTQDVQDMIQGIRSIEGFEKIDHKLFDENKLLVQSLGFLKKLGKIKMLPPHQDEISNYIKNNHLLPSPSDDEHNDLTNDLFESVGLSEFYKQDSLTKSQVKSKIKLFKNKAIDLYKANYLIHKPYWLDRIKYIFNYENLEDSIIELNNDSYDLNGTISSTNFTSLHRYFQSKRKHKTKANFRDALALALLINRLDEYKKDNSKPLPIFYSTSSTINLINKNIKLHSLFCFPINGGKNHFSILRGDMYFILDVLFNLKDEYANNYNRLFLELDSLKRTIGGNPDYFKTDENHISNEIKRILESKFFISFWFEKMVENQFSNSILELIDYKNISDEFGQMNLLRKERKALGEKISKNLNSLKIIQRIWMSLDNIDDFIENKINRKLRTFDVFTDFGLTKFSLIKCEEIQSIINDLINYSDSDETSNTNNYYLLKSKIINSSIKGLYEKKMEELFVPISVFWIFEEYDILDQILSQLNYDYGEFYQLAIIHANSLSVLHKDMRKINRIIEILENENEKMNNYKIQIGISCIFYNLWKNKYNQLIAYKNDDYLYQNKPEIVKANWFIKSAKDWLRKYKDEALISEEERLSRNRKYYYSLNNFLYYKIRSEKNFDNPKLEKLIDELEIVKTNRGGKSFWQPRFAHTLALAYFRMSYSSQSNSKKNQYLTIAKKWIDESIKKMPKRKEGYIKLQEKINLTINE